MITNYSCLVPSTQVLVVVQQWYLTQLREQSKTRPVTVDDLRSMVKHVWLSSDDLSILIDENILTWDIVCQFYLDYHEHDDIDERHRRVTTNDTRKIDMFNICSRSMKNSTIISLVIVVYHVFNCTRSLNMFIIRIYLCFSMNTIDGHVVWQ
jgi:hypothetical protein